MRRNVRGSSPRDEDGGLSVPDGAVIVERGKSRWRALIEVKTGSVPLKDEQVTRYLDMARAHGFDCVLTISNQITAKPDESPVFVDKRKLKRMRLRHLSWWRIVTTAVVHHRFQGVSDPDQAWILGELIAYLDHENSGASGFDDLGPKWVAVRDAVRQGTLRGADAELHAVCKRWRQFIDYLALGLSQDLGRDIAPLRPRGQSADDRVDTIVDGVVREGVLSGGVKVPDAVGPLALVADLRTRQVTASVTVAVPKEGRPKTRVNWILRQLREVPPGLRIEAAFANVRETTSMMAPEALEYPGRLLSPSDPKREPRSFTLALTRPMGVKRGKGQGSFVGDTRVLLSDFYRDIVQDLRAWQPKAPRFSEPRTRQDTRPISMVALSPEQTRLAGDDRTAAEE